MVKQALFLSTWMYCMAVLGGCALCDASVYAFVPPAGAAGSSSLPSSSSSPAASSSSPSSSSVTSSALAAKKIGGGGASTRRNKKDLKDLFEKHQEPLSSPIPGLQVPPSSAKKAEFGPTDEEVMMGHLDPVTHEHNSAMHIRRIRSLGNYPVLVLNSDCSPLSYLPLSVIRWQEAIKAIFLERVVVLDYYDRYIHSTRSKVQLPSVVCLKEYHKSYRERAPALNRRNIYIRDRYECQYCMNRLKSSELTLDHVMPKSKGGKGTWDNLVTCCRQCNRKKGKRTIKEIKEIGMQLMTPPRRPSMHEIQATARHFRAQSGLLHETWTPYLGLQNDT